MCVSGNIGDDDGGVGGDILNILLINKTQRSAMRTTKTRFNVVKISQNH